MNEEQQQKVEVSEIAANPADPRVGVVNLPAEVRGGGPEALLDPAESEMEAFLAWREAQPREFWGVIDSHGREVFELAFLSWQAGAALGALAGLSQEALGLLAQESARTRKLAQGLHPGFQQAWGALHVVTERFVVEILERRGLAAEKLQQVQTEIQQAAQLAQALGGGGGNSGLVVVKH